MSKEDVEKWRTQAANVGPHATNPLDVPFDIAIKEATQTAGFIEKYWEPKDGKPGLKRTQKRLPLSVKADLLSLIAAIQTTQTEYLLIVDPRVIQLGERANFLINKLENVLGFVLDDGIDEPEDAMLAQLKDFHSQDSQRSAALSQSLQNYATLAEKLASRIKQEDEDFDLSLINEAFALAGQLREKVAQDAARSDEAKSTLLLRNQLLTLMVRNVRLIRKTASYVFEDFPQIIREATSDYERRRRNKARLDAKLAASEPDRR